MGRLTLWFLVGLTLLAVSLNDLQVSAEVGPTESECQPYIEKAIKELKTGDKDDDNDSNEAIGGTDSKENDDDDDDDDNDNDGDDSKEKADDSTEKSGEKPDDDQDDDNDDDDTLETVEVAEDNKSSEDSKENDQADTAEDDDDSKENTEEKKDDNDDDDSKADDGDDDSKADDDDDDDDQTKSAEDGDDDDGKSTEAADDEKSTEGDSKEDNKSGEVESSEKSKPDDDDDDDDNNDDDDDNKTDEKDDDSAETKDTKTEEDDGDSKETADDKDDSKEDDKTEEQKDDDDDQSTEADDGDDDDDDDDKDKNQNDSKEDDDDQKSEEDASVPADQESEEDQDNDKDNDSEEVEETITRTKRSTDSKAPADDDDSKADDDDSKADDDDSKADDDDSKADDDDAKADVDDSKADDDDDSKEVDDKKDDDDSKEDDGKPDTDDDDDDKDDGKDDDDDDDDDDDSDETTPEDDLLLEGEIPENLRDRKHISELLHLNDEDDDEEQAQDRVAEIILRDVKRIYENAIKPLETLYKYRDLSNRHFSDPEIFSKPLVVFMGPWSGGKSSLINYLTDNEYKTTSLRTGAEPSPAYFNILMWGNETEVLDGTQLAADWTFSGLQKFGQGLEERLRGLKMPNKLLEKVNIVEIPGILEVRKQVSRHFPFNDACQWFIDRADIIFLIYDPAKLDVGPETEAILDQLKGREYQTRIILNKADTIKPEELLRVQGALIWNISPLMSSAQPPVMYTTSLWSKPYDPNSPIRLLQAQERAFLRDLRTAVDKRIENRIASARRFAVRVRNHAKMVDCYLNTYYNHKTIFGNKKRISDEIIENPQNYHIYEGLSTLTNISRYDLPDPDVYKDFFRLNPLYEFNKLSQTCTYFRGCPINKLDVAIAYDLPELVGKYKKMAEEALRKIDSKDAPKGTS